MLRATLLAALALSCVATGLPPGAAPQDAPARPADDAEPWVAPPLERSFFAHPLYLSEEPPEVRSVRHLQFVHAGIPGVPIGMERTQEEALELAATAAAELRAGADFTAVARERSEAPDAARGGVMGTFARGMLASPMDAWLFSDAAELGAVSDPVYTPTGYHVLQRIETHAAARQVFVRGTDAAARARLAAAAERLEAGEAFVAVARELSEDPLTAERGGALQVYERGPEDSLLRKAAFDLELGARAVVESPLGLHLVERVPIDSLAPELREITWIRVHGLAVLQASAQIHTQTPNRTTGEAKAIAQEVVDRLAAGEAFAGLARRYNDDRLQGRERGGEVGWIHRRQPGLPNYMDALFRAEPGEVLGPVGATIGWLVLRRDR